MGLVVDISVSQNGASFDTIKSILFGDPVSMFLGTKYFGKYIFHFDEDHLIFGHHIVCFRGDKCLFIVFKDAQLSLFGSMKLFLESNIGCFHLIVLLLETLQHLLKLIQWQRVQRLLIHFHHYYYYEIYFKSRSPKFIIFFIFFID